MKLTDAEKLIVLMLSDLLIQSGQSGEINAALVKSAITSENEWAIDWEHPIFEGKEPGYVTEVADIILMWSLIEAHVDALGAADLASLKAKHSGSTKFAGFDGNNETEHYSAAKFMIEKLDRFTEFSGRDLNSHMPKLDKYRRMLAENKRQGNPAARSIDDLVALLSA